MEKQFTATVYILEEKKVLLLYHRKLQKWLPPGGHMEPNETPPEAARREVLEETGFSIEFIRDEHIWVDHWNAKSIERPLLCLLEEIPAHKDTPAHQHIDLIFAARPLKKMAAPEAQELCWFALEDIAALRSDIDIFAETKEVISMLIKKYATRTQNHA